MKLPETTVSTRSMWATSPDNLLKTAGYYFAFVALGLTTASLGPTLPGLAEHTRSDLREISFLFSARSLGYLLGSLISGRFYDKMPGHPVMAAVLFSLVVMMAITPLVPLLWLLSVVLLVIGLAEGAVDVGGNTLLVWVHRHRVGPFMNALHFFFGVGAFISPLVVGQAILRSGGITWAYWLLALLILPSALWVLRLPSPAKETAAKDDPAGQTNYLLVGLIVLFFFFYTGIEAGMGGWTFTYATSLGMPEEMAAYLNSAFWGALTLGRLLSIPLAARFRPRSILLSDLAGCLVSLAIILLWPGSPLAIWIGVLGVGLSIASVFPTTLSLAERRMVITGQMTGWFFVGASAGAMFLPWLIGQLFEAGGPQIVVWVILVDTTLATSIFFVLIARSARMIIKTDQV